MVCAAAVVLLWSCVMCNSGYARQPPLGLQQGDNAGILLHASSNTVQTSSHLEKDVQLVPRKFGGARMLQQATAACNGTNCPTQSSCGLATDAGVLYKGHRWNSWQAGQLTGTWGDAYGIPINSNGQKAASASECACRCAATPACIAYLYSTANQECWMQSNVHFEQMPLTDPAFTAGRVVLPAGNMCSPSLSTNDVNSQLVGRPPSDPCNLACLEEPNCVAYTRDSCQPLNITQVRAAPDSAVAVERCIGLPGDAANNADSTAGNGISMTKVAAGVGAGVGGMLLILLILVILVARHKRKSRITKAVPAQGMQDVEPNLKGDPMQFLADGNNPNSGGSHSSGEPEIVTGSGQEVPSASTNEIVGEEGTTVTLCVAPKSQPEIVKSKVRISVGELQKRLGKAFKDPSLHKLAVRFGWCPHIQGMYPLEADVNDGPPGSKNAFPDEALGNLVPGSPYGEPPVKLSHKQLVKDILLVEGGLIDQGSAGVLFKCCWPSRFGQHAVLAAKIMRPTKQFDGGYLLKSYKYEAHLLSICRHPNVVRLYGYCLEPPTVCLIMELLPGSLWDRLYGIPRDSKINVPSGPMTMSEILTLSMDIAAGLEHLHACSLKKSPHKDKRSLEAAVAGSSTSKEVVVADVRSERNHPRVVHRDLKPGNILISSQGRAKISDFGLARQHVDSNVHTQFVGAGTLHYMAPELINGQPCVITSKVDIYSLGMIMWEMVSRKAPWDYCDTQVLLLVSLGQRPPLPTPQEQDLVQPHQQQQQQQQQQLRALPPAETQRHNPPSTQMATPAGTFSVMTGQMPVHSSAAGSTAVHGNEIMQPTVDLNRSDLTAVVGHVGGGYRGSEPSQPATRALEAPATRRLSADATCQVAAGPAQQHTQALMPANIPPGLLPVQKTPFNLPQGLDMPTLKTYYDILSACWSQIPLSRPLASTVHQQLIQLRAQYLKNQYLDDTVPNN